MTYLPLRLVRIGKLSDAPARSFFRENRDGGSQFVVGPTHAFCVGGRSLGYIVAKPEGSKVVGFIYEDVDFEVVEESFFAPAMVLQPLGGLVIHEAGLGVLGLARTTHGFDGLKQFILDGSDRPDDRAAEFGYSDWRVTKVDAETRVTLFDYKSAQKGDVY